MDHTKLNAESRAIWDANAEAWDKKIGAGGGLQTVLITPTVERMLNIQAGERVLDIACGNGGSSLRITKLCAPTRCDRRLCNVSTVVPSSGLTKIES